MIMNFPREPFTQATALALGITKRRLADGVREATLLKPFRNVYIPTDIRLTTEVRARAAALVINDNAVVCDRTAAWIWGVDCFQFRELDGTPPLEIFMLRGHRASRRPEIRGGQRELIAADITMVGGVRVTTPSRTALDLGCGLGRRDALAAMDALARACELKLSDFLRLLPRYAGRRGVVQLRELVPLVDARAESAGESWMRMEIHDHGLPRPEVNWWVDVDGVRTFRLDLAYPHAKVAVEYDGEEFHSRDEDKAADAARRKWLEQHGWIVIVVDKASFTDDAIHEWITAIREALKRAQTPPRRRFARA
jgi:Protein of unknown function (DUF559)